MNKNQPSNGANQIGTASRTVNTAAHVSNSGTALQMKRNGFAPAVANQTLMIIRLRRCERITAAIVATGIAKTAVSNFEITVSASVIGSERQNRMLLSLRSAYKESKQ